MAARRPIAAGARYRSDVNQRAGRIIITGVHYRDRTAVLALAAGASDADADAFCIAAGLS